MKPLSIPVVLVLVWFAYLGGMLSNVQRKESFAPPAPTTAHAPLFQMNVFVQGGTDGRPEPAAYRFTL